MILRIGRWGQDVEIDGLVTWQDRARAERPQVVRVAGDIVVTNLAEMQAARIELLEQVGALVAVTWTTDPTRDGFYQLLGANLDLLALAESGRVAFSAELERVGGESHTELQSTISGTVRTNDHGVVEAETQPYHAAPVGVESYDSGVGSPTVMTRTSEDGDIYIFQSVDFAGDPSWSVPPSSYYAAAAEIWVSSRLRAGKDAPNDTDDFMLTNGLIRVTPDTTAGVTNGRLNISTYDGAAWDTAIKYGMYFDATTVIPEWRTITIMRNTPEVCIIRLVRDATEAPPTSSRHLLDLCLRRGSRFVEFHYAWTGGVQDIQVRRETPEAATAITPAGAASSVGIRATADDVDGNRYVLATPHTHVQDLVNGRIYRAASTTMSFMIGAEVAGAAAVAGDTAAELMLQYLGHIAETVRAIPR